MNAAEQSILRIEEETDRQFAVEEYLRRKDKPLSAAFVNALLNDQYEVVRAEIVDHLISSSANVPEPEIARILRSDESQLVRGRLFLLAGALGYVDLLNRHRSLIETEYERTYWTAGMCLSGQKMRHLLSLLAFIFDERQHVAETALDLVMFVRSSAEDGLIREVLRSAKLSNPGLTKKIVEIDKRYSLGVAA